MSDNQHHDESRGFKKVEKKFEEDLLQVSRVTKVTAGGRQLRFRATVVIGDRNGQVGLGIGKASEVVSAIEKAVNKAKRSMIRVPIKEGTIPHEVKIKHKSARVMIHPAAAGTGVIAGGPARRILDIAGYQNILAKYHSGSKNPVVNAQATIEALKKLIHIS